MAVFLKEAAVASQLGVGVRTLQRWRSEGVGPAYARIGLRRIAYRAEDLDRWIANRVHVSRAAEIASAAR